VKCQLTIGNFAGDFVKINMGLRCVPLRGLGFKLGIGAVDNENDALYSAYDANNETDIRPKCHHEESEAEKHSM
jgi:hypothetical protein